MLAACVLRVAPVPLGAFRGARPLPASSRCTPSEPAEAAQMEGDMCKVINKHTAGSHADAVYIGRGSKWGNPFRIGIDGDRAAVIAKYETWLCSQHHLLRALDELRGRNLLCFCAPKVCHGDLLLRLANASREERIAWWRGGAA